MLGRIELSAVLAASLRLPCPTLQAAPGIKFQSTSVARRSAISGSTSGHVSTTLHTVLRLYNSQDGRYTRDESRACPTGSFRLVQFDFDSDTNLTSGHQAAFINNLTSHTPPSRLLTHNKLRYRHGYRSRCSEEEIDTRS